MANLITEKQKREIKIDYYVRFSAVVLFIFSLLGIFLLAYVIPYYISVNRKYNLVAEQFKSLDNKADITGQSIALVNQTAEELSAVDLYYAKGSSPSVYFNKIIENKNPNIKITRLSFSLPKADQAQLLVSGLANNRDGLVLFIEDLKSRAGFASVESPVSSFAKESNIAFTLNIKTKI
jgi:hypothetical protein